MLWRSVRYSSIYVGCIMQPHKFCATDFEKYEIRNRIFVLVLPKMVLLTVETPDMVFGRKCKMTGTNSDLT